jgi:hypothetical protein
MPLTKKGKKIISAFKKRYGKKLGTKYFYMSANSGRITKIHGRKKKRR